MYTSFARDGVRGCDPMWLRKLYGFARKPDVTFYFKLPLQTALGRILDGRTKLKYFEAGMDLGFSIDIRESFQIFQQMVMEQYDMMADEFEFIIVDASRSIPVQQEIIRSFISNRIDLAHFKQRVKR
jgi:dTMP kinase